MKQVAMIALAAAFAVTLAGNAFAAGDAEKGKDVAKKCVACHDLTDKKQNKVGPALWGIVGAKAGAVAGYKYSTPHMEKAKDIIWDEATLHKYLADPKGFIPGNKMTFAGIKDTADMENLIAFMKTMK